MGVPAGSSTTVGRGGLGREGDEPSPPVGLADEGWLELAWGFWLLSALLLLDRHALSDSITAAASMVRRTDLSGDFMGGAPSR